MLRNIFFAGGLVALMGAAPVLAEYPEKPIELIVAFAPGGGTDVAARSVALFMEKHLGNGAKIAVVNKPGAGGEIGWTELSRAKPDGYTIGMINPPAFLSIVVEGKAKYKVDDFAMIGNIVLDPGVIVVGKDSEYKTLDALIQASKDKPDAIVVGNSGAAGSSDHIGLLQLNQQAGTSFKPAFFGSTAPVRQALMGGHIPAATMNLSEALELQRSGDFHILGIMAETRNPAIPDVPTFKEKGADVVVTTSRGLAAPAGADPAIIAKLQAALQAALADPDYAENAKKADIPVAYLNATDYRALIDQIVTNLEATWKATPWR